MEGVMRNFIKRLHFSEYLTIFLVSLVLYLPILWMFINWQGQNDYWYHTTWAQSILIAPQTLPAAVTAHAGWQWLVLIVRQILDCDWSIAALVVTFFSMYASAALLHSILRRSLAPLLSGALSFGLLIVAPILVVPTFGDIPTMANGYLAANVYHNPTVLLLKPFAIAQFVLAVWMFNHSKSNWKGILLAALVSAAAVFSKPSYVICLLPAMTFIALVKLCKKQPVDWLKLVLGFVLPSVAFLIWQFLITFGPEADSRLIFAPLMVMSHFSNKLLIKLLLSILFPLLVTVLCWKDAIRDIRIQLGWSGFIVGCLCAYFLAETGTRQLSANFVWSAEITLLLLFFGCVLFLVERQSLLENLIRKWFILTSGFSHILFGVTYYFYLCISLYFLHARGL